MFAFLKPWTKKRLREDAAAKEQERLNADQQQKYDEYARHMDELAARRLKLKQSQGLTAKEAAAGTISELKKGK